MFCQFLSSLQFDLKVCNLLQCIPFEFQPNARRLIISRSSSQIQMFKLQCILSILYVSEMFLNLFFGSWTVMERLEGSIFFLVCLFGTISRWNYSVDIAPIQSINGFIFLEDYTLHGKARFKFLR